jgi:hypothetical protein
VAGTIVVYVVTARGVGARSSGTSTVFQFGTDAHFEQQPERLLEVAEAPLISIRPRPAGP